MKICIFGGGAIGGLLAIHLTNIGIDISVIARGQHLDVIKKNGITLIDPLGQEETAAITCISSPVSRLPARWPPASASIRPGRAPNPCKSTSNQPPSGFYSYTFLGCLPELSADPRRGA